MVAVLACGGAGVRLGLGVAIARPSHARNLFLGLCPRPGAASLALLVGLCLPLIATLTNTY